MHGVLSRRLAGLESQIATVRRGGPDTAAAWTLRFRRAHPDHEAAYRTAVERMAVHTPGLVHPEEPGPDIGGVLHSFVRQVVPPVIYPAAAGLAWTSDRADAAQVARTLYRHLRSYQIAKHDPCPSADGFVLSMGGEGGDLMIDLLCVPESWPGLLTAIAVLKGNGSIERGVFR